MNPRIAEIIENVAILNQDLRNTQENDEILDILGKIKLFSAQLYLETDMEIIALNRGDIEFDAGDFDEEDMDESDVFFPHIDAIETDDDLDEPQIDQNQEPAIEDEDEDMFDSGENVDNDLHFVQEISVTEFVFSEPPPIDSDDALDEEEDELAKEEEENFIPQTFEKEEVAPPFEAPEPLPNLEVMKRANEILGMFSLTRRYEFVNFLFGGDMHQFVVFITELIQAPGIEAQEAVFDRWYEEGQWRRKEESAMDLKRSIRKML